MTLIHQITEDQTQSERKLNKDILTNEVVILGSHVPAVPWLQVDVRRQQRAEAKQWQVHSGTELLHLGPALSGGSPGGRGGRGHVRVAGAGVAVVMVMVMVVVGVRRTDAAAAAVNQEGPPVVTAVQHAGGHQ